LPCWAVRRRTRGAAEKGLENIPEAAEIEPPEALPRRPRVPEPVVLRPLVGIRKDRVRLVDLLELLRGAVIGVAVRVVLEGQLAEGLFYLFGRGVAGDPEHLVIITF
jgi:hypothetical protein